MKTYALLLVAEGNKNNKGDVCNKYGQGVEIAYEDELIQCIWQWRMNGGKYADIPIYVINGNGNPPSKETIKIIRQYNAMVITRQWLDTKHFPCGYYNTPFALKYLEKNMSEDILIHIDLDMYLMKEPTEQLLHVLNDSICKVAINEFRPTDNLKVKPQQIFPFEIATNFIVSERKKGFYKEWWRLLHQKWQKDKDKVDVETLCVYEERICDIMYFRYNYNFDFFKEYQLSEKTNDENIDDIYFIHCHLDNPKRFDDLMAKYLRMKL